MSEHWTDRLSDYLDGDLTPGAAAELEAHLRTCPECAGVLEDLRAVVSAAGGLEDSPPARDLWDGIRTAIAPGDPVRVIDLDSRRGGHGRQRATVRLSVAQLVAAGLALAFVSAGATWLARPDAPATPGATPPVVRAVADSDDGTDTVLGSGELVELEELLARHRAELDPGTVRILEKNLAAIDRAIEESLEALATDPGNEFLEGHLERARERKLEYLRQASAAFQWST